MRYPIVVGVDDSPAARAAAGWAAREALRRDAPLLVLHTVLAGPGRTAFATPTDPRPRPAGKRWTPFVLADEVRAEYPELSLTVDEVAGHPLTALLDTSHRAELLVLGAHGARTTTGFLLGSVALGAAGRASMPVVLVRPGTAAEDEHVRSTEGGGSVETPYRDVVLGLNLAWPSDGVIGFAFEAAARRGSALRVVHGWSAPGARTTLPAADGAPEAEGLIAGTGVLEETLAPWQDKFPQTKVVRELVVGPADRHLLDASADASLLVIGRRARPSALDPRTGSTSRSVLRHVQVPVAVVPAA